VAPAEAYVESSGISKEVGWLGAEDAVTAEFAGDEGFKNSGSVVGVGGQVEIFVHGFLVHTHIEAEVSKAWPLIDEGVKEHAIIIVEHAGKSDGRVGCIEVSDE
jgi:hypothetical protein